ncbi:MAG: PAS domain S-box protein, partial [Ignavibacteriales bacterium]
MDEKSMANNSLRVLCLEDNPKDAEIIFEILTDAKYDLCKDLTSTKKEFKALLHKNQYDIILSDFKLPGFDAFGALKLCKEICPDIPFVCVSGSIGEEIAIDLLKEGAVDYVLKDRLARLPIAVRRAIDEAKEKKALRIAELELIESEQRFRTLYENAKIGLYRTTPDGKILLANKALIKMLGYQSFEELVQKDLNKEGFASKYKREIFIDRIESEGEVNDFESEWICKDGTAIFVRESAQAIRDSTNSINYYDGIVENITERKKAEEALKKSEEKLKELFENAPVGYHEIDEFGNTSAVNKTELKMLGYSYEEMIGVPIWKFSRDSVESRERVIEKLTGIRPPNKNLEQVFVRKDETLFTALVDDVIFHNEDGVITGIRTIILDITERKQAEEAFKELSLRQQAILASVPDIIMEVDNNKIYTWANRAGKEFFGEDVISKDASFYFEGEQDTYNKVKPLFNGYEDIIYIESWQRRKDGQKRLLAWWCKVLKDINGNITGALSSARDITEQQQAEEALQISEERLRMILDATNIGIWDWDLSNGRHYSSLTTYFMLGYEQDDSQEFLEHWMERIHPDDREMVREVTKKIFTKEVDNYDYNARYKHSDGSYHWLDIQGYVMDKDLSGNPLRLAGIQMDITERKKAENALQKSEERYRKAETIGHVGSWEYNIRNEMFWGSDEAKRIYGFDENNDEFSTEEIEKCIPERERIHQALIDLIQFDKEYNLEFDIITKSNQERKTIFSVANIERDETDQPIKVTGIIQDITERKKTEKVLQNERLLLRTLIDNIPDAIYVKDLSCRKTLANKAELRNMKAKSEAEVLGKDDFDWYPRELAEGFFADDQKVLQNGKPVMNREEYVLGENDKKIWLLSSKLPLVDKNNQVIGLLGIGRDITEKKIVEERQLIISNILSILNRPNEWQQIIRDILNELKSFTEIEAIAIRLKE